MQEKTPMVDVVSLPLCGPTTSAATAPIHTELLRTYPRLTPIDPADRAIHEIKWHSESVPASSDTKGFVSLTGRNTSAHNIWEIRRLCAEKAREFLDCEDIVVAPERANWTTRQTITPWIHMDHNPWARADRQAAAAAAMDVDIVPRDLRPVYQAVVALNGQSTEQGGFVCIPDFTLNRYREWVRDHDKPSQYTPIVQCPDLDHLGVILDCPPGSYIVWDDRMPHSNASGTCPEYERLALYVQFYRRDEAPDWMMIDHRKLCFEYAVDGMEPHCPELLLSHPRDISVGRGERVAWEAYLAAQTAEENGDTSEATTLYMKAHKTSRIFGELYLDV